MRIFSSIVVWILALVVAAEGVAQDKEPPLSLGTAIEPVSPTIAEADMTQQKLAEVLKKAGLEASLDADNDVQVMESGIRTMVRLLPEQKLLAFVMLFKFSEESTEEQRVALVNEMNNGVLFARFSATPDGLLVGDYNLPYEKGVQENTLLQCYRWFFETATGGIKAFDKNGLVR